MKNCIIVIPIYSDKESLIEKYSLESLYNNLSKDYDICFIGPDKLKKTIEHYIEQASLFGFNVSSRLFNNEYFQSPTTYSQLLKTYTFYSGFKNYKYLLIYQTDCFMLEDNLKQWIDKNYDYIGAPILVNTSGWRITPISGNGGISLRRIKWFMDITNPKGKFLKYFDKELNEIVSKNKMYQNFEDLYFIELCGYYHGINIPKINESLYFAWDMNPDIANTLTNGKLPDILHAYDKNLRWYKKYINNDILKSDEDLFKEAEEKYKDLHKVYMTDINNPSSYSR